MKKELLLFLMLLLAQMGFAQSNEQMQFQNDFREAKGGQLGDLTKMFLTNDFWDDGDGSIGSIIRVKVVDMSASEAEKLSVKGSTDLALGKTKFLNQEFQWYITVGAGTNKYMEMVHPTYGTSSRLMLPELKPMTMYDVTLVNNKTTSISVSSIPDGADIFLDGNKVGKTPMEITGQRFGKHTLKLMLDGKSISKEIDVEEGHTTFGPNDFDFRATTLIDITSDPDGASIFIDDDPKPIGLAPIKGYRILLGSHTFRAINPKNMEQNDEKTIRITESTTLVDMHPVKKGNVHVTTVYGGRPVAADLVVDAGERMTGKDAYDVLLPYGKHSFMVSYGRKTKEKVINVNKQEQSQKFKLSAKNEIVWPWEREFNQRPFGFSMGYVQKQIVGKSGSMRVKGDPAFNRLDKTMGGMSVGIHFQPTLSWGLGFYSGAIFELYATKADKSDIQNVFGSVSDYKSLQNFTEYSLNVPLHLYYRIAFSENFSIAVHGGLGVDMGLYACYSENFLGTQSSSSSSSSSSSEVYDKYYGEDGCPNWLNLTWDIAGTINMGPVAVSAYLSKGFINHDKCFVVGEDNYDWKYYINKFGISVSWLFGAD